MSPRSIPLAQAAELVRVTDSISGPQEVVSRRIVGGWVDATRTYPGFHHGNRLVLDAAPEPRELAALVARYRRLFAWRRTAYPVVITWCEPLDAPPLEGPLPEGEVEEQIALLAPPRNDRLGDDPRVRFRRVEARRDWDRLIAAEEAESPEFGTFSRWRVQTFEQAVRAGGGAWYSLEDPHGELLASAGLFLRGQVARFASVLTIEAHRRHGYARILIERILRERPPAVRDTVIVAERASAGEALYRSLGFTPFVTVRSLIVG